MASQPTHEQIAQLAYCLLERRVADNIPANPVQDWITAEAQFSPDEAESQTDSQSVESGFDSKPSLDSTDPVSALLDD